jgi:hypothetical protein
MLKLSTGCVVKRERERETERERERERERESIGKENFICFAFCLSWGLNSRALH